MIVTILLLLIFILLVWNYYVHHGRKGRLINLIPGLTHIPIFGMALLMQIPLGVLWRSICDISDKYYPITKSWNFFVPIVFVRHPDDLKIILNSTKHVEKSIIYDLLHPWFGTSLLTSGDAKWRSHRKILTPAFHFDILKQFVDVLIKEGNSMKKSLEDIKGIVIKDLVSFTGEHTLNVICSVLSYNFNKCTYRNCHGRLSTRSRRVPATIPGSDSPDEPFSYLQKRDAIVYLYTYRTMRTWSMKISSKNIFEAHYMYWAVILLRPWLHNNFIFALSPKGKMQAKILKMLHGFTEKIIAERKLYHKRTNGQYLKNFDKDKITETNNAEVLGIPKKQLTLLDILIAASREGHLTDLDIREEIDTFIFKGHDTVRMTIIAVLSLLAEYKDIQEHVRTEINNLIEENGEKLNMQSLQNLSYLDRCIKEALRLYPSMHLISRVTSEDVKLSSYLIPNGTMIYLNIYQVHRDPNFWPNPDVFDPDRFLPEKIQNRHPYSYLPFSAGPRNCIGQQFAILEIKAMIVPLIRNFYLEPIDYLKDFWIDSSLILLPDHPIRVRFVPIECGAI